MSTTTKKPAAATSRQKTPATQTATTSRGTSGRAAAKKASSRMQDAVISVSILAPSRKSTNDCVLDRSSLAVIEFRIHLAVYDVS